ncbi:nitroreductase [Pseudomonas huaxiensis]|uniref:nitroreductase n=1 Tax=Pseudomonas huaxiensis TaxID=2213017 RepID=UPI000DA6720E|nr:nitroreductase [Pseudomonas huaxiensis]
MSSVMHAVINRRSTRAFLDRPVAEALLREIVDGARHSPSSGNLQPWKLYVLTGAHLRRLKGEVARTLAQHPRGEGMGYAIYPQDLKPPYQTRRAKCGEDLYATLNIAREDRQGRQQQFARNFRFFDAPVGLFLAVDRSMGQGQWADLGMFLQSLMLLAHERGLATCAQACWTLVDQTVERQLELPDELMLFCGLSLGYADPEHPVNTLRTDREPLAAIAEFRGFDEFGA